MYIYGVVIFRPSITEIYNVNKNKTVFITEVF